MKPINHAAYKAFICSFAGCDVSEVASLLMCTAASLAHGYGGTKEGFVEGAADAWPDEDSAPPKGTTIN